MQANEFPPDVFFVVVGREKDSKTVVDIWTRDGMHGADMAARLHEIADGFATGEVERIR